MSFTLRRILLASAFLTLALGALAGLARLQYGVGLASHFSDWHGMLMTGGFAGLLISLERAVALEKSWGFAAPLLIVAGTLGLVFDQERAPWLYVLAGAVALAVQIQLARRRTDMASVVMALGSLAWAMGMLSWAMHGDFTASVLSWAAFPVLVIAGERLELAFQVMPGGAAWWIFLLSVAATLGGPMLFSSLGMIGARVAALGWLGLALWMLRHDILGRGYKNGGQARFMSIALWTGYAWLAIAAIFLWRWASPDPAAWDGAVHALFLGFMFAMIFAHATVIFPAVSGVNLKWHRGHYAHLGLMAASLMLRLGGGLSGNLALKREGALCSALTLAAFVINQIISIRLAPTAEVSHA